VFSAPVVASGTVYIGSTDTYVYAIDTDSGTLRWKYRTDNKIYSSPTVNNGVVYFSSVNGSLYAVQ
jgi:outer membrane protein assembly factor BamB